ncbi:MAG: DUF177 domain-containing protein [candidate division Zixibacteria bacterium]|nr:DUF177 domain-containing protein [candidate division Zixibacteria bacterium]
MNLDLREFATFPVEISLETEADSHEYEIDGISFREPMALKVSIQKIKDDYYCHGSVMVPVEKECSRCLNIFDSELSGDFSFIIRTADAQPAVSDNEGEIFYVKFNEPIVELDEIIRQALILSLPLKPLCDQDCKGLCPSCGINLNEETCDCRHKEMDERWEGLKDLFE